MYAENHTKSSVPRTVFGVNDYAVLTTEVYAVKNSGGRKEGNNESTVNDYICVFSWMVFSYEVVVL